MITLTASIDPVAATSGAIRILIWLYGAYIAMMFGRWWGLAGFLGMAINTGLSVVGVATAPGVPGLIYTVSTVTATPVAAALVHGYQSMQVRLAACEAALAVYEGRTITEALVDAARSTRSKS